MGSRFSILGTIAGTSVAAALAGALAAGAGCSSERQQLRRPVPSTAARPTPRSAEARRANRRAAWPGSTDAVASSDAGAFNGLSCAVTPCAIAVATGGDHVCVLLQDHTARCWGQNASGELGSGTLDAGRVTPSQSPTPIAVAGLTGLTLIAAGGYGSGFGTSCAGAASAGVQCWGSNAHGVLGLGLAADGSSPPAQSIAPLPLALGSVVGVALGGFFGCGLVADGGVSCWGDDTQNELGRLLDAGSFDPTPTPVPLPGPASAVATGKYHACALLSDHSVECWGADGPRSGGAGRRRRRGVAADHRRPGGQRG